MATSAAVAASPASTRSTVVEILLHDTLQAVSAESFRVSLRGANAMHPTAILLNLSTPGGLAGSAAEMVEAIRASPAPVIVFVREPGTHVSGQGMRLLEAGDVRAVQPETVLTPALPVMRTGRGKQTGENALLLRQLADDLARRGRTASGLVEMFQTGGVVTSEQALRSGLSDASESTEDRLLAAVDGMTIRRSNGSTAVLRVRNAEVVVVPMTAREHMMRALMNPDLTVLLLGLGGLLIYLEVNTPGGVVPGAAGVLLVLLAVYALLHLPLRWEALLLLAGAGVLLLLEAHFERGMVLAVIAMGMLVVGLRLLVNGPIPELEVNWGTAVGAGVGFGGVTAGLLLLGLRARRAKVRTGSDAMLGWLAVAHTTLAPEGQVLVRGELWRARLTTNDGTVAAGDHVKVLRADGLTLEVTAVPMATSS